MTDTDGALMDRLRARHGQRNSVVALLSEMSEEARAGKMDQVRYLHRALGEFLEEAR